MVCESPDIFNVFDLLVHFAVLFGCGSFEEMASHWWFGGADPQQDRLSLPELVHPSVGHICYLLSHAWHAFPECGQVGSCIVAIESCLALCQEGGDARCGLMEACVKLSCYGGMHMCEVLFFYGKDELVQTSVG